MERCELGRDDPLYPRQLLSTPWPPERLYVIGDPSMLRPGLGVVGARRATPYGLRCATRFAGWAASAGVPVVSGGAHGCDLQAHIAALEASGPTVAVLGCGADVDYPASSAGVLRQLRSRCAVVSELPWGTRPIRHAFVLRNRIIAGLSYALLVVEAGLPSGTFTTANYAADAGRPVLAVPGCITSPGSRGPNRLISDGATPVTDVADLADALRGAGLRPSEAAEADGEASSAVRDRMLGALLAEPSRPDDLARDLDMDLVFVLRRVGELEAKGEVRRYPDGRYGP